jgi:hypothetical protein
MLVLTLQSERRVVPVWNSICPPHDDDARLCKQDGLSHNQETLTLMLSSDIEPGKSHAMGIEEDLNAMHHSTLLPFIVHRESQVRFVRFVPILTGC